MIIIPNYITFFNKKFYMKKIKKIRISIKLECINCKENLFKTKLGISRYMTTKNRHTMSKKLQLIKHCKFCNQHNLHKEIK
jgi:ribosomal protein L33